MINNKILIQLIYILIPGLLLGEVFSLMGYEKSDSFISIVSSGFFLTVVYFLVKNGTLIRSREYRLLSLSIAVLVFATMFKIMHWPYTAILFGVGFFSIIVIYGSHFIKKPDKNWIDWAKLFFLIGFLSAKYFRLMHFPYSDVISIFATLLLILTVVGFIRNSKGFIVD